MRRALRKDRLTGFEKELTPGGAHLGKLARRQPAQEISALIEAVDRLAQKEGGRPGQGRGRDPFFGPAPRGPLDNCR